MQQTEVTQPPASAAQRRRTVLLALLPVLVPVVVFGRGLLDLSLIAPADAFVYELPMHILTARDWLALQIPSWNPYSFSGMPLLATGQTGAFYPPDIVFLFFGPFFANNLLVVFNIAAAGVGAFLLSRRLTGDEFGAAVSGIGFASCGFFYGQLGHPEIEASAAWLPWIVWGYLRLRADPSVGRFLVVAVALALSLLGGHPQMFFLSIAVLVVYALLLYGLEHAVVRRRLIPVLGLLGLVALAELIVGPGMRFGVVDVILGVAGAGALTLTLARLSRRGVSATAVRAATGRLCGVPGLIVAGAAIAAVQLLPSASILGSTVRSSFSFADATAFSFTLSQLPLVVFPFLYGNSYHLWPFLAAYHGEWSLEEFAGYPGLACLVIVCAGLPRIRRDARASALALTGLLFLLVALGGSTGVGAIVWRLPAYGSFRAWARYTVVADLAVAVLAGYGIATLRGEPAKRRAGVRRAWFALALLAALAVTLAFLHAIAGYRAHGASEALALGLPVLAAALGACACTLLARGRRLAAVFCCLVVALDGFCSYGAFAIWRTSPSLGEARAAYAKTVSPSFGTLPRLAGGLERYFYSVQAPGGQGPHITDLKGIASANGYDPLEPSGYAQVVGGMTFLGNLPKPLWLFEARNRSVLDLLRVSLLLAPAHAEPRKTPAWLTELTPKGGFFRYEYRPRLGAAFLVGEAEVTPFHTALERLEAAQGFDAGRLALIQGTCRPCGALVSPGEVGTVRDEHWGQDSISVVLDAKRPAVLVLSEAWFPGWRATLDGHAAQVHEIDGLVLGVVVPPGRHKVQLSYEAPGFTVGAAISSVTLAGFAALLAVGAWRRRSLRVGEPHAAPLGP